MKTDETPTSIALQPETEVEQALLSETFTRLTNLAEAPGHPEKVGSTLCYYTLDVDNYDLDLDLWREAECGVNEHGKLDPEPGSRALVVVHSPEEAEREASQEAVDEAVESLSEGGESPTIADFSPEEAEVAEELATDEDIAIGDLDYDELQEYAKRVGIAANQSADELREAMFTLAEGWVEATSEIESSEVDG